jgi:hypothetical protein
MAESSFRLSPDGSSMAPAPRVWLGCSRSESCHPSIGRGCSKAENGLPHRRSFSRLTTRRKWYEHQTPTQRGGRVGCLRPEEYRKLSCFAAANLAIRHCLCSVARFFDSISRRATPDCRYTLAVRCGCSPRIACPYGTGSFAPALLSRSRNSSRSRPRRDDYSLRTHGSTEAPVSSGERAWCEWIDALLNCSRAGCRMGKLWRV